MYVGEIFPHPLVISCTYITAGGWALIGVEGTSWSINSTEFQAEILRGGSAFFQLFVDVDDKNSSQYILQVGGANSLVSFPDHIPFLNSW